VSDDALTTTNTGIQPYTRADILQLTDTFVLDGEQLETWTPDLLESVFDDTAYNEAFRRGTTEEYEEILTLMNAGIISLHQGRYYPRRRHTGSHDSLKRVAVEMLQRLGETRPHCEYSCSVGRADVVSLTHRILVECGNTYPRKVVETLRSGYWQRFVQMPFPEPGPDDGWLFHVFVFTGDCGELKRRFNANRWSNPALSLWGKDS
jgi:hypothetical protein